MTVLILLPLALVAFTWLGYPIVVAAAARLRGDRTSAEDSAGPNPSVTVILATIGDDTEIAERVRNIAATRYPHSSMDIVVSLDARRTPDSIAGLEGNGVRVSIVRGDQPGGKAVALNAGVRTARGEILVFADLAQRFDEATIPLLVDALRSDDRMGAVSGALHISKAAGRFSAASLYWRMERRLRRDEARVHSAVGVTGAVYAMRRALWAPLPNGLILDDLYAPMQLVLRGYRIGFEERALAHDARHFAPRDEYRRKARTLTGVLQLCAWLPAVLGPIRNPIWVQFVTHKLLRLATPWLLLLAAVGVAVHLAGARPFGLSPWIWGVAIATAAVPVFSSRRMREGVVGTLYMQAAMVKATVNGLRGHWDVWQN
ncbi:MAG: hypothetical protein MNPFHGCM_02055 [Gemmatimonadaceae bacterium]|nr:hypothetical protein [Gemmatimonadaceae bacterium]